MKSCKDNTNVIVIKENYNFKFDFLKDTDLKPQITIVSPVENTRKQHSSFQNL